MSKKLIINENVGEYRASLIENGEILDFLIERNSENTKTVPRFGNIYVGKVLRVLPGMQSAFVDIGYEKAAFLYVDDAYIPTPEEQKSIIKKSLEKKRNSQTGAEVIPDELSTFSEEIDMKFRPNVSIETFLSKGQEIIVQIAKEPISSKGPRITRHISLAGRYVVFMPFMEHIGVSRRIENEKEREKLREILNGVRIEGKGLIARTAAEGQSTKVLRQDFNMISKIWKDIEKKSSGNNKSPCIIYNDLSFIQRILRDIADEDISEIIVDTKSAQKEAEKFINKFQPAMKGKLRIFQESIPIFEKFGVEIEIERALSNKVYLRSGGSLNIDQTEALVSIDVNTGKFVGRKTLEDTILKTNLEAVKEIAYQLRLRNCGGIIIIDFIDMEKEESRENVFSALIEALKKDRSKTNVFPISGLGLVEMTRKRTRDTLTRVLCSPCPYCEGMGKVKSVETVCSEVLRELVKVIRKFKGENVTIYAHPEVASRLSGETTFGLIDNLEEGYGKIINVRSENAYHVEQYEIFPEEY